MNRFNKKYLWIVWLIVSVLSFVLLFLGVKGILKNEVTPQNILAFTILSLIFGGVSATFYFLKATIGLILYIVGLCIGFFEMYRTFINGMGGWGDLVGLMSLFTWAAIGLVVGLVVQLVWHLYKKMNARRED